MAGWIYILLCAACSVTIAHLFKVTEYRNYNTVNVLTVNYAVASITAFFLLIRHKPFSIPPIDLTLHSLMLAVIVGVVFIANFFVYSKSVHQNGVGISVASMRISLIVPVLVSALWYSEALSVLQWIGVIIVFLTLFLLLPNKKNILQTTFNAAWLLVILFVLTGFGDAALKVFEREFSEGMPKEAFMGIVFFTAFLVGIFAMAAQSGFEVRRREVSMGILIGVPNLLTAIFLIAALEHLNGAIVYSSVNVLTVVGATIVGIVRWRDHFTKLQWTGLALAICSIYLFL